MSAWLSVVTVVKDDADGLRRTVASLLAQDDVDGIEYVVIDSSSDRASSEAALADAHNALFVDYTWTKPAGIYAAMNTGLARASGEVVHFLNAGDTLFAPDVLSRARIAWDGRRHGERWMFGPVEIVGRDGRRVITPPWDYRDEQRAHFGRGLFPPHQGTFAERAVLDEIGGFDTSFAIAADYAAFLALSLRSDPVRLPFPVASFREGGVSTTRWRASFAEFHRARTSILQPRGVDAWRERADTAWHFAKVFAYRDILRRGRTA